MSTSMLSHNEKVALYCLEKLNTLSNLGLLTGGEYEFTQTGDLVLERELEGFIANDKELMWFVGTYDTIPNDIAMSVLDMLVSLRDDPDKLKAFVDESSN